MSYHLKLPLSSWLIRCKARVCMPGQASKRNLKKIYISATIFSQQISAENSEGRKPALKKFLKKLSFGVDFYFC